MKNLLKSFKIFLKKTNTEPHLTDNEITTTIGTEQKLDPAKYGKEKKLTFAAEVPPEDLNQSSSSSKTNSFILSFRWYFVMDCPCRYRLLFNAKNA